MVYKGKNTYYCAYKLNSYHFDIKSINEVQIRPCTWLANVGDLIDTKNMIQVQSSKISDSGNIG